MLSLGGVAVLTSVSKWITFILKSNVTSHKFITGVYLTRPAWNPLTPMDITGLVLTVLNTRAFIVSIDIL